MRLASGATGARVWNWPGSRSSFARRRSFLLLGGLVLECLEYDERELVFLLSLGVFSLSVPILRKDEAFSLLPEPRRGEELR